MTEKNKVTEAEGSTPAAATLQTKSAMMSGILAQMASMSHEDMMKWFPDAMELAGSTPNAAAQNQASVQTGNKGSLKEDIASLFGADDLNEEGLERVTTLIEHAVNVRSTLARTAIEEEFAAELAEQVKEIQEDLTAKADQYITYAVEQWIEKNEVAIETSLKVERAEKLFDGIAKLMAEARLELPEAENVAEGLQAEIDTLKGKLNEQIQETIEARQELNKAAALSVFRDVAEGLTVADTEKFRKLVEDVEINEDAAKLRNNLKIIREAHFKTDKATASAEAAKGLTEVTGGEGPALTEEVAPTVEASPYAAVAGTAFRKPFYAR